MFDIRWIRDNPNAFDQGLAKRNLEPLSSQIIAFDEQRRANLVTLQEAQTARNEASKKIGQAKASGDEAGAATLIAQVAQYKEIIAQGEAKAREIEEQLQALISAIPNLPGEDTPQGEDEADNLEINLSGQKPAFEFAPRKHYELGELYAGDSPAQLPQWMDFDRAAKLAGSRFVVLSGPLARLHRALAQFMIDTHVNHHGYTEVYAPLLVNDEVVYGTGQLPKFAEDLFRTRDGRWLTPTAEVSLTNLVREEILDHEQLPLRLTALTPCFRSEAGSAGKDTRGMFRQHQFDKVELVSIVTPVHAAQEHERMLNCARAILDQLELHYRTVVLCTGDLGFSATKTYDIEVWLPGQQAYREISSCSVCGDFQARRMNARYRPQDGKSPEFVNTLNGSGVAVGRALIAVLENYQNEDGSVRIPKVLQPYMGNQSTIEVA